MNTFDKGRIFEQYVKDVMFPKQYYSLVRETPTYEQTKERFVEDCIKPDFTFRRLRNNFIFHIEAKYRNLSWIDEYYYIEICTPEQWKRYCEVQVKENVPVFIALALGDDIENPNFIFLIPLNYVHSNKLRIHELFPFLFMKGRRVFSDYLKKLLNE